jgi:hypothetical protein
MPARPIIPARQIAAICAALRPGQRAEIAMPGGAPIRIYGAPLDGEQPTQDAAAEPTAPDAATIHDLAASIRAKLPRRQA